MSPPTLRNNKPKGIELDKSNSPATSLNIQSALVSLKAELMAEFSTLLNTFQERIVQKISDIAAEVSNLRTELQLSKSKLVSVTKRCESAEHDIINLRAVVSKMENKSVAADAVIMNVPNNIDATVFVNKMMSTLSCEQVLVHKVFRTNTLVAVDMSVPIILKLRSADDRVKLFKALALYRKNNNKQLMLSDLGFDKDISIFVHECLTSLNRDILRNALHYKKTKIIVSAFTLRGTVYIKTKIDGKPYKVLDINELHKIVGGA